MSEEGAQTVRLTHAETQTHASACGARTGGAVQLQTPADAEEKRVSTSTVVDSCPPSPSRFLIWAQLESTGVT